MDMLGFLCALTEDGNEGLLLIGPSDGIVFVDANTFPPSLQNEASQISQGGKLHVLGALVRTVPDAG